MANQAEQNRGHMHRHSEATMRAVIDSALDAVIIIDDNGRITEWNHQAATMFGWERDWALGRKLSDTIIPEQYREMHERGLQHFLATGEGPVLNKRVEVKAIDKEGREFPVELTIIPHKIEGKFFFSSFVRDLTEQKKSEQTLNAINDLAISLLGKNNLEEIGWEITKNTIGLLGLEDLVIYILDEEKGKLHQIAAYGPKNPTVKEVNNQISINIGEGIVGKAAAMKQTMLISDTSRYEEYIPNYEVRLSELAVPIIYEGEVIGVIDSEHSEKKFYKKLHLDAFSTIASLCSSTIKSAINVKKREEIETHLRESEERWQNLVENMPEALQISKNGKVIYINPAGMKLYEADSLDEIVGVDVTNFAKDVSPELFHKRMESIMSTGKADPIEFEAQTLKGTEKFLEVNSTSIYYNGEMVIQSVLRDITEKKKAEQELNQLSSRLQTLIDNLNTGVLMEEADRTVVHANKQFCDLFGNVFTPENLHGQYCPDLLQGAKVVFKDPDAFIESTNKIVEENQPSLNEELELIDGRTLNRDFIPIEFEGTHLGIVWQYRDITEVKKAEKDLRRALDTERSYSELNRNFVSMVSHEFRTPLTSIHSTSELLLQFGDRFSPEDQKVRIERIYNSTIRMNKLIEDVLTMGKLDSENSTLEEREFIFDNALHDVINVLKANTLEERDIQIKSASKQTKLNVDQNLMELILRNLIENAAKYSDASKPIQIRYGVINNHFEFSCRDYGIGIPEKDQRQIFESFKRASNTGNIKGTGLGLSIVNKAVKRLGGLITLQSEVGKGTTITIQFPVSSIE